MEATSGEWLESVGSLSINPLAADPAPSIWFWSQFLASDKKEWEND